MNKITDPVKNFGKVTVSIGYDDTATSIALSSDEGVKLPDPGSDGYYNVVWYNSTDYNDPTDDPNKEVVRVTAKVGDTLTVIRAQEGTSASTKNTADKTYKMILAVTTKIIDDLQGWKTWDGASRTDDSTISSVIHLEKGTALKYRATSGVWQYGTVISRSTNAHTIMGAKCTVDADDEFMYTTKEITTYDVISINGSWADSADSNLLENDLLLEDGIIWRGPPSVLVGYYAGVTAVDTGVNQPRIQVNIRGVGISTANTNAGIEPSVTAVGNETNINTSNYTLSFGDPIELETDANGSNNDSKDLKVELVILTR